MKHKFFLRILPLAVAVIVADLSGQQDPAAKSKMGQMKDKMKDQMKDKMGSSGMTTDHREMAQLVEKLAQSLAGLEGEHDHTALMAKLAEHRKLIEQLQAHVAKHGESADKPAETVPAPAHQH